MRSRFGCRWEAVVAVLPLLLAAAISSYPSSSSMSSASGSRCASEVDESRVANQDWPLASWSRAWVEARVRVSQSSLSSSSFSAVSALVLLPVGVLVPVRLRV